MAGRMPPSPALPFRRRLGRAHERRRGDRAILGRPAPYFAIVMPPDSLIVFLRTCFQHLRR